MEDEILKDVNASQDQIVDGQYSTADVDGSGESINESSQEVVDPGKKAQTPEENTAFKEMRMQIEALTAERENTKLQAKRDAIYASKYPQLGFTSEEELKALYGDEGISSYEDLDKYYDALEQADKLEMSPQAYKEIDAIRQELNVLKQEKESILMAQELEMVKADMTEQYGDIFTQNEKEIIDLAERMGMKNASGIKASVATVITDKFPQLMKDMEAKLAKAKEDGVKEFIEKKKTEIPIEGNGNPPSSVGTKPKDSWTIARESAMSVLKGNS